MWTYGQDKFLAYRLSCPARDGRRLRLIFESSIYFDFQLFLLYELMHLPIGKYPLQK